MQDLGLAAQATQGGMDYANFGAGMVGMGGEMLQGQYGTQKAAYNPYSTAIGGATMIEGLGQSAMDIGTSLGERVSTAGANQGNMIMRGQQNAGRLQYKSDAYNPWAGMLNTGADYFNQIGQPQGTSYDPGQFRLVPL
jgi:hypothetical protein